MTTITYRCDCCGKLFARLDVLRDEYDYKFCWPCYVREQPELAKKYLEENGDDDWEGDAR